VRQILHVECAVLKTKNAEEKSDRLLKVSEASEILNVHPQTVYRLAEAGQLPVLRLDGIGIRFRESELEKWIGTGKGNIQDDVSLFGSVPETSLTGFSGSDRKTSGGLREMAKAKIKSRYNLGYGTVYQRKTIRGNIRWYLDYRGADGKRIQKLAPHAITPQDAVLSLQSEVARIFNREYRAGDKELPIKFGAFAEVYLSNYAKVRKRSWRSDEKYINAQLIPFFGKFDLNELTPLHVSQFMVKRQGDGVKNSTINRELTVLKKMLGLAMEWGFEIKTNPVKKGNYFSEEEYRRERVLKPEEEKRLFEAAAPHLQSILSCGLATGMRYSEILGLKWENVDLVKRQIIIKAESSKSGRQRIVPINCSLHSMLLRLKQMNKGMSDYVFLYEDPKSRKFRHVTTVRRAFTAACKRAKIKNLHFHDLRHTVGTRLIESGVDPISVKNILGHANLKTTEIYLHSSIGQMMAAVEKLNGIAPEKAENPTDLLHICDTEHPTEIMNLVTPSSAVS